MTSFADPSNAPRRAGAATPPVLGRKPSARTYSIEELMELVLDGKIRVPEFQRPIQWVGEDARRLLDSIFRGYPIGTLLFWKKSAPAATVSIGHVRVAAPELSDALWVVDGQQRIWTLAAALLAEPSVAGEFAVVFDLDTHEFLHPRGPRVAARTVLPLNRALDSQRLMEWLFERGLQLSPQQRASALALGKAIREFQLPGYEVDSPDESALRQIFRRLNSYGKGIGENDVFDALHGTRGSIPSTLRELADGIARSGFGRPEDKLLLKAAKAIAGADLTKEIPDERVADDLLHRTARAVRDVAVFFERDARIPRYELVPYKTPFATLCRFFDLHPEPRARSRELLARWIWRGAVSGIHSGDTTGARKVLDAIDADEETSVQRLLRQVGRDQGYQPGQPFNFRHATSKLEVLALLALAPRNIESGEPVIAMRLFEESPPGRPPLEHLVDPVPGEARTIANRWVHPHGQVPFRELLRTANAATLRSHGVVGDGVQALRDELYDRVVDERAKYLRNHIASFLARRMRWDETDRPSLDALRVPDDE